MGASEFHHRITGTSMQDAYEKLASKARHDYGHDYYSGTIGSTNGFMDFTTKWGRSGKSLTDFMNDEIKGASKQDCYGVCTKPPKKSEAKVKTQVKHIVTPGTKKWVLKYVVYALGNYDDRCIKSCDTKAEAVKKAKEYTEKTQQSTIIVMEKVLEKGNPTVAAINYKSSAQNALGEYVFFGLAPY